MAPKSDICFAPGVGVQSILEFIPVEKKRGGIISQEVSETGVMKVSYKKLWYRLIEHKMSGADLRRVADFSPQH